MESKGIVIAALGCGLVLGSCDGSTDVDDRGTPIPFEDIPEKVAEAICAAYEDCLGDFMDLTMGGEDCVTVAERRFTNGSLEPLLDAIDAGTATYDGHQAQACLDALAALGCDALVSNSLPECEEAFAGSVAEGGDCTYDVECVGDLFCEIDGSCPGTCTARGGTGTGCDEDEHCQDGLRCDEGTSSCVSPAVQGGSCGGSSGNECTPGLLCLGEDEETGTPGTCSLATEVLVGEVGDSCNIMTGPWCQTGAHCAVISFELPDTLVTECVAAADSGGSCHLAAPDMCPAGQFCEVAAQSTDGNCELLPQAGEACADSWTKQCDLYHRCINGTCHALEDNGGSCVDDEVCYSDSCNGGVCGPYDPC